MSLQGNLHSLWLDQVGDDVDLEFIADCNEDSGAAIASDLSQPTEIQRMFAELAKSFGDRIDFLVNCAGQWMNPRQPLVDCSDELIEQMWAVNARSVMLCCRAVIPTMIRQASGVIVNVSSNVGHSGGGGGTVPYCAAKAAVNTLTRGLSRELGPHGIRVVGVAPGVRIG